MTNREVIQQMYQVFFNDHQVEAALKYVRPDYIQHNPGVPQGREGFMKAFAEKFRLHPEFHLEICCMICEGDMAAVYLKSKAKDGTTNCRVVDIYRLEQGQLAEHWDVLQPVAQQA